MIPHNDLTQRMNSEIDHYFTIWNGGQSGGKYSHFSIDSRQIWKQKGKIHGFRTNKSAPTDDKDINIYVPLKELKLIFQVAVNT